MSKRNRYNETKFEIAQVNGNVLTFECWTSDTSNGFCHTAYCPQYGIKSRSTYINRTWESFRYQCVLRNLFEKLSYVERTTCEEWNKRMVQKGEEDCKRFCNRIEAASKNIPQEIKDKIANSNLEIKSMEDAEKMIQVLDLAALLFS